MTPLARTCFGLLATGLLVASSAVAQEITAVEDGPEIVRDAATLVDVIRPRPEDPDVTDTVLIFTNQALTRSRVKCVAFEQNGNPVGRAWLRVPGLGLRYALASDVANGLDFVGHVRCFVGEGIVGSALLLAAGELSDLPVRNGDVSSRHGRRILFPVVATY